MPDTETRYDLDAPVKLHPLVYLTEGDEVTIGRRDTDSYGIFPEDGAEIVRRLEAGQPPQAVARWYEQEYGESADIEHVLAALEELELLRTEDGETGVAPAPVRWQRLGQALFSPLAWVAYAGLIAWAVIAMIRSPELVPNYRALFFTEYYTLIELGLFLGAVPLLLLHEAFHALAGRRLGIRSQLRVSRRLYYIVLETNLDGLVSVPRRKRYLPILAGVWFDVLACAMLTIAADLTRNADGGFSFAGRLCLAFAFATVLRVVWQFFFYLRTDLYALITTLLGCVDLHTTARRLLRNRFMRAIGRTGGVVSEADWHPVDRAVARWYSWLIVAGYTISIVTFVWAVLPAVYRMFAGAIGRLYGEGAAWAELLDSTVFLGLNLSQVVLTVWLALRERRMRRKELQHVIS
jgi:hypothetical protein